VAVLSDEESREVFGVPLADKGAQPVWVSIENRGETHAWFFPITVDAEYFAPLEAAYPHHSWFSEKVNRRMDRYFEENQIGYYIPPGGRQSGFVYARRRLGVRYVNVELFGEKKELARFGFTVPVPGGSLDYLRVDFETLYPPGSFASYDLKTLRQALDNLACCTTNASGDRPGDPVNLVVVGKEEDVLSAFVRRGWRLAETLSVESSEKTASSFLFGSRYMNAPVSPLHLFGRKQDIALQKARDDIDQRNHLRLWLAPFRFEGESVWVGQISRDIGVRFTLKTPILTTHKIDPDVDEARDYLLQDMLFSNSIRRFGYARGVGAAGPGAARENLTGDPYSTDGKRLVVFVSGESVPFERVIILDWELPTLR